MADKKNKKTVIHVHYVHHFHHNAATPQQQYIMGPPPMHAQPAPQSEFIMAPMAPGFFAAHYEPPKTDRDDDE